MTGPKSLLDRVMQANIILMASMWYLIVEKYMGMKALLKGLIWRVQKRTSFDIQKESWLFDKSARFIMFNNSSLRLVPENKYTGKRCYR